MATDIVVCGAAGRMGRLLVALGHTHPEIRVAAAVEQPGASTIGRDAGEVAGIDHLAVGIVDDLGAVARRDRVILDFTTPSATLANLRVAVAAGAPIVIGTTGLTADEDTEVRSLARRTRTVMAPNMSLGVNVLMSLVRHAARALGPAFDVEVVELHHRYKQDAPSGTALALARAAAESLERPFAESAVFGRHGQVGARRREEIGVLALRAGDAVGEHTVLFGGIGERIELSHRAQSRECLAAGALRAALWIADRPNGLYSMADVLGLA
jgi:4-hydroxy-tetrahydrodipicolinate reductase